MQNLFFFIAASICILSGIGSCIAAFYTSTKKLWILGSLSLVAILAMLLVLWVELSRPPFQSMGETRLWYAFFLTGAGLFLYKRMKNPFVFTLTEIMCIVFVSMSAFSSTLPQKYLVPALQSLWFIPHVAVYMLAYALCACAFVVALFSFFRKDKRSSWIYIVDDLMMYTSIFLSMGLIMGSLWAKEVWGDFWTWDPKENWAGITLVCSLACVYIRYYFPKRIYVALLLTILCFLCLQMCWYGVNYLPHPSLHTY